ncbi:MAG TPA: patatin-like phospholipase family protein [Polyangiaceae bacterium]|nr:patatin-like phospholipase family protein [Polyangiaceae bacterium]
MPSGATSGLALTLTGGGARGAYQAGVLSRLGEAVGDLEFGIITGVSAGAINAAFLANHRGHFGLASQELAGLWNKLSTEEVLRGAPLELARNVTRWGVQLLSGGMETLPRVRGLLDTEPLRKLLTRVLVDDEGELSGVRDNLERRRLKAFAVTTTSYATGQAITFAQHASDQPRVFWERPYRVGCTATIGVEHVMASAAIPLLFPAVKIGNSWHGDGSVRQAAPLSPALRLGARRVLVISTVREPNEHPRDSEKDDPYPSLARIVGVTLNSLLYGHTEFDAEQLRRITDLVRASQQPGSLRPVELFLMRPSADLGHVAAQYEHKLPRALRYLTRGLGTRDENSTDLLSTLLFDSAYTEQLVECGRRDAEAQLDALVRFVKGPEELPAVATGPAVG